MRMINKHWPFPPCYAYCLKIFRLSNNKKNADKLSSVYNNVRAFIIN